MKARFLAAIASLVLGLSVTAPKTEAEITKIAEIRQLAEAGNAKAQRMIFEVYRRTPRGEVGPGESSDTLFSRAEAEAGLRAAAAQGDAGSALVLSAALLGGRHVRSDIHAALAVLQPVIDAGGDTSKAATLRFAFLTGLLPEATTEDRAKAADLLMKAPGTKLGFEKVMAARVLATGDASEQAKARTILEALDLSANPDAAAVLGDLLARGLGGPADVPRGTALLASAQEAGSPLAGRNLGLLYAEGTVIGPDPRKAIRLMARQALVDYDTRKLLGELLIDHHRILELPEAEALYYAFREDADAGVPGAAWLLIRLLDERMELFRGDTVIIEVMWQNARTDDNVAVYKAHYEGVYSETEADAAATRATLDALCAKGVPSAFTAKGHLLETGAAYPQDSVGAFETYLRAAELGDLDGMVALAKAYSDGLGTDRDPGQEVMWLQKAADLGSVAAQEKLLWGFRFGNGIRMHDAVVSALRLWAGGSGSVDSSEVGDVISTAFRQGSGPDAVAQAVMDGLRAGPAALDDSGLAYVQKNTPRELWLSIEARLLASGHYKGEVSGFFRPDARAALAAWVAEAGPLPRN
jgi:TPR repeat protein